MDRVTLGLLKDFKKEQSLPEEIEQYVLFEHFANYCVISKEYNGNFAIDDVHVGGKQDISIDGIAIIVDNNLVTSLDETNDLAKRNRYLDVSFILI